MAREMRETSTQPQRMVTDWPSVRVMYIVVERPKGTAMMAKELRLKSACCFDVEKRLGCSASSSLELALAQHLSTPTINQRNKKKLPTYSPSTLNILKFRGSSLAYPIFASAASALPSPPAPLATDAFLPAPVCVMLMLLLPVSISFASER